MFIGIVHRNSVIGNYAQIFPQPQFNAKQRIVSLFYSAAET